MLFIYPIEESESQLAANSETRAKLLKLQQILSAARKEVQEVSKVCVCMCVFVLVCVCVRALQRLLDLSAHLFSTIAYIQVCEREICKACFRAPQVKEQTKDTSPPSSPAGSDVEPDEDRVEKKPTPVNIKIRFSEKSVDDMNFK